MCIYIVERSSDSGTSVSYTHLDVYKRQQYNKPGQLLIQEMLFIFISEEYNRIVKVYKKK